MSSLIPRPEGEREGQIYRFCLVRDEVVFFTIHGSSVPPIKIDLRKVEEPPFFIEQDERRWILVALAPSEGSGDLSREVFYIRTHQDFVELEEAYRRYIELH